MEICTPQVRVGLLKQARKRSSVSVRCLEEHTVTGHKTKVSGFKPKNHLFWFCRKLIHILVHFFNTHVSYKYHLQPKSKIVFFIVNSKLLVHELLTHLSFLIKFYGSKTKSFELTINKTFLLFSFKWYLFKTKNLP